MIAIKDKVVSLLYKLQENDENGPVLDQSPDSHPLTFLFGAGQLLPDFEKNIMGLKPNDTFAFKLTSEQGYGEHNPEAIQDLPKQIFVDEKGNFLENEVVEGRVLPLQNQQGQVMRAMVKEIGDEVVTMDFNHPMAGKNLYFTGKILHVRDADQSELEHGHVHGPGGHQH